MACCVQTRARPVRVTVLMVVIFNFWGALAFAPSPWLQRGACHRVFPSALRPKFLFHPNALRPAERPMLKMGTGTTPRDKITRVQRALLAATGMLAIWRIGLIVNPLQAYQTCIAMHPITTDVVTAILLYILGKITSDAINEQPLAQKRVLGRWGILGFMDGYFTGMWYRWLETVCCGLGLYSGPIMAAISTFIYTPLYSGGFIAMNAALSGVGPRAMMSRLRRDFVTVTRAGISTWGPLNVLIFSLIPVHLRVVVSMASHYVYLVFLAMWDSGLLGHFLEKSRAMFARVKVSNLPPKAAPIAASVVASVTISTAASSAPVDFAASADPLDLLADASKEVILTTDSGIVGQPDAFDFDVDLLTEDPLRGEISPGNIVAAAAAVSSVTMPRSVLVPDVAWTSMPDDAPDAASSQRQERAVVREAGGERRDGGV
jgi:hypothetical protein